MSEPLKPAVPNRVPDPGRSDPKPPEPDLGRLESLVSDLKARKSAIAAREQANKEEIERLAREEFAARKAREGKEDLSDLQKMLERFTAGKRVLTPEEEAEMFLKHQIIPQMQAWRYPERYHVPIEAWGCPPQEKVFKICRKLASGVGAVIAMIGERGTGKTTVAAQLAISFIREDHARLNLMPNERGGRGFKFRSAPYRKLNDLIATFKPLYTDQGSIRMDELSEYRDKWLKEVDLLIIDEVHDCEDLKVKNRLLVDVIDRRYAACKDVILISNQTKEKFEASTDDSILSRITQHGMIIPCAWGSWRTRLSDTAAFMKR